MKNNRHMSINLDIISLYDSKLFDKKSYQVIRKVIGGVKNVFWDK